MAYQSLVLIDGSGTVEDARRLGRRAPINTGMVRASAIASSVRALAVWANRASVAWRIDNELESIRPQIDAAIRHWSDNNPNGICYVPERCGCLVHVILSVPTNWPSGERPLSFEALFQAECGLDPAETLIAYLRAQNLIPGVPEGTEAVWRFVWVKLAQ